MAGRFVAVAGGIVLAAGVGAFVAERAGWFDTPGWPDALPGLGPGGTSPPVESVGEPAPAPQARPPRQELARPDRKPAPDAIPPGRKPDGLDAQDAASAEQTAQAQSADQSPERSAGQTDEQPADAAADPATSAPSGPATDTTGATPGDPADAAAPEATPESTQDPQAPAGDDGATQARDTASQSGGDALDQSSGPTPGDTPDDPGRAASEGGAGVRDPSAGMRVTVPTRERDDRLPVEAEVAPEPQPEIPSFDIVRVERNGEAVIAGRAAPRSRVTVLQGDQPIATAKANQRGEFVAIPHRPLPPGQRQLTLRAEDPETGDTAESDQAVVIDIPRMPDDGTPDAAETTQTAETPERSGDGPQVTSRSALEPPSGRRQAGGGDAGGERDAGSSGDAVAVRDNGTSAPPADEGEDDAPAATVTDVPEPAGKGPEATGDGGARVTARQDAAAAEGGAGGTGGQAAGEGAGVGGGRGDAPIAVLVPRQGTGEVEVLQRPSGETGLEQRDLVLEAVQYTVDGGISISGRAPAEALVVAYLNDTELARTRAPADGDWTMTPTADIPPGLHTLRVEQVGPDGRVQASVSTPFANQPMVDELDQNEGMVVIQPGDNLWTIARRTYGQGWEYTLIYRANRDQIRDPDLIYPGQVFVVPEEQRRQGAGQ